MYTRITEHLSPDCCLHAVGQGALGIECREDDRDTLALLEVLNHRDTVLATVAERAFMKVAVTFSRGPTHLQGPNIRQKLAFGGPLISMSTEKKITKQNKKIPKNLKNHFKVGQI